MTISVKDNEMNLFKKCLVIAGFEPYSDMKYGGTFYLDVDGQHVLNNAASKKDVPFDTILNRIRNCGAKRIEPWMVNEINEMLRKENSILTLEWEYTESNKDLQEENRNILCNIRLVETKYIDTYIVNPTKEFYTMIENYFTEKGLTRINYNNTKSTFWNLDGYSKRDFYYEKKN